MTLALIGWMVVHSLWQWTSITGVTALAAGLVRDRHASVRYVIASAGLLAMLLTAIATLATGHGPDRPGLRFELLYAFNGALMMPEITPRGRAILRVAAIVWVVGVTVGAVRMLFELRRAWILRRDGLIDPGREMLAMFARLRQELGVTRPVVFQCSTRASVPMLLGWRKPLILLPATAATTLDAGQIRAVLAHELGHVRRWDDVANLVQVIADVAMFHHPAARWISRLVRAEREYSCDDIAIGATRDATEYARALAAIEDARTDCRLAVAAASGTLLDRIQRILAQPRRSLTRLRGAVICAMATALSLAVASVAINIPPPSVPAGVRMRRPMPGRVGGPGGEAPRILMAQGLDRGDRGGAPRREVGSQESRTGENRGHHGECLWVDRGNLVKRTEQRT